MISIKYIDTLLADKTPFKAVGDVIIIKILTTLGSYNYCTHMNSFFSQSLRNVILVHDHPEKTRITIARQLISTL